MFGQDLQDVNKIYMTILKNLVNPVHDYCNHWPE